MNRVSKILAQDQRAGAIASDQASGLDVFSQLVLETAFGKPIPEHEGIASADENGSIVLDVFQGIALEVLQHVNGVAIYAMRL